MISNLVIFFAVILFLGLSAWKYKKNKHFWELYFKFKGDKPLPIVGNALSFGTDTADLLKTLVEMWERHDRETFTILLIRTPFLIVCDVEAFEAILDSTKEIIKMTDYDTLKPWLGDGLLVSNGNKWRIRRKILTPAFHFKILENFMPIFDKNIDIFVNHLEKYEGQLVDVYPFVTLCALDVISESSMGVSVNFQENSDSDYVRAVHAIDEIVLRRAFSFWKRFWWLYIFSQDYRDERKAIKIIHNLTKRVIKERRALLREEFEKNSESFSNEEHVYFGKKKYVFLDILLLSKTPDGKALSDEDVREEVDTFMFEGHDTISSCISFALYMLSKEPKVQQLAFEEQFSMYGKDYNSHSTYNDLQNMNYLERVIKETLRLYPSVPYIGRKCQNDIVLPGKRIIPEGTEIHVDFYLISRDPKYWEDPLKFDPDRYLPENSRNRNPFLYVPFSAGPRNCIGQKFAMLEIKSLLSRVLRKFELLDAGNKYSVQVTAELTLKSKNGMNVILRKRE